MNGTFLRRAGRRIVDANGSPVVLRGVNLGGWLQWEGYLLGKGVLTTHTTVIDRLHRLVGQPATERFRLALRETWITEGDIAAIARLGFNVVRVPLHHDTLEPGARLPAWLHLDQLLDWCEAHGVWAVLDLHAAPLGQSGWPPSDPRRRRAGLWRSGEAQDRAIALWRTIAARYRHRAVVAGYDLLNEPWPPSGQVLTGFYARVIASIRSVDPDHLIFVEGGTFGFAMHQIDRVLDPNLCLSFHMYTWFDDTRRKHLKRYVAQSKAMDLPVWAGEFGENSHALIASTVGMYEEPEAGFSGWAFWPWKRAAAWFPGLGTVETPPAWRRVINWAGGWFARRPPADVALAGMDAFVESSRVHRMTLDPATLSALLPAGIHSADVSSRG